MNFKDERQHRQSSLLEFIQEDGANVANDGDKRHYPEDKRVRSSSW
jgi:hypothetical protein